MRLRVCECYRRDKDTVKEKVTDRHVRRSSSIKRKRTCRGSETQELIKILDRKRREAEGKDGKSESAG